MVRSLLEVAYDVYRQANGDRARAVERLRALADADEELREQAAAVGAARVMRDVARAARRAGVAKREVDSHGC